MWNTQPFTGPRLVIYSYMRFDGFTRPFDWVYLRINYVLLSLVPVLLSLGPVLLSLGPVLLRMGPRMTSELTQERPPTCLITMSPSDTRFSHNQVQNAIFLVR